MADPKILTPLLIAVYILIGIMLCFIGPLAKKLGLERRKLAFKSIIIGTIGNLSKTKAANNWKKLSKATVVLYSLAIFFFPLLYIILLIDWIKLNERKKKHKRLLENSDLEDEESENIFLFFNRIGGAGSIQCKICGHSEEVISFIHGYTSNNQRSYTQSCQCQSCGKIHKISGIGGIKSITKECECGGELNREAPLICPSCKSTEVKYDMDYIT